MKATIYLTNGKRLFATVQEADQVERKDGFVAFPDGRGRLHKIPVEQVLRIEFDTPAPAL